MEFIVTFQPHVDFVDNFVDIFCACPNTVSVSTAREKVNPQMPQTKPSETCNRCRGSLR
jgi:hypothetical protein